MSFCLFSSTEKILPQDFALHSALPFSQIKRAASRIRPDSLRLQETLAQGTRSQAVRDLRGR